MAGRRAVSNLLALAVLVTLTERPMHPYEMAATMRSQGKERSIKLNYGSLYTVVNNLARHGLIEAMEAGRAGRRPERTVYRITEAGRKELGDWMAELVAVPVKEYPQFEAALAELPVLPPGRALELLRDRAGALEQAIAEVRAELAGAHLAAPAVHAGGRVPPGDAGGRADVGPRPGGRVREPDLPRPGRLAARARHA